MDRENIESALRYLESELATEGKDNEAFHECVDDCRVYWSTLVRMLGQESAKGVAQKYPAFRRIVQIEQCY